MKSLFTLTLCVLVVLNSYGQKQSVLTTGLIELAFYPVFATVNDYYVNNQKKKSMLQLSVALAFGKNTQNRQ